MDTDAKMNEVSRLSAGTVFRGEIVAPGDIRMDGRFEGQLRCAGRLVAGERAVISGDVVCGHVDFGGTMPEGHIYARETLSLKGGSCVLGDLYYKRIQIDLDARVSGALHIMEDKEFEQIQILKNDGNVGKAQ